jgi:hypothetical protein
MATSSIIKSFKGRLEVYEYLRRLTDGLNEQTYQLFVHIYVSTILKRNGDDPDDLFSPIPVLTIREFIGRSYQWRELRDRGLIDIRPYWKAKGRCREYKVSDQVLEATAEIIHQQIFEETDKGIWVNLFTGEPCSNKAEKSKLYDEATKKTLPNKTYCAAIQEITRNYRYFNKPAVLAVLKSKDREKKRLAAAARRTLDIFDFYSQEYWQADAEAKTAKSKWQNDNFRYESVLRQNPEQVTEEIWCYTPCYIYEKTGRTHEKGGGFQSASREMKAASLKGLEDAHNYDLKSSHLNVARHYFQIAGIDTAWIDELLLYGDEYKKILAKKLGWLEEGTAKLILIILLNGGELPDRLGGYKKTGKYYDPIVEALRKDKTAGKHSDAIQSAIERVRKVFQPLVDGLEAWRNWIEKDFIPNHKVKPKGGKHYIKNAGNNRVYLDELPKPISEAKKRKRRAILSTFFLQGLESHFVHILTILGPKYGFKVIANEHDGVICLGEIPKEAIDEAKGRSGFEFAELVEKEICKASPLQATPKAIKRYPVRIETYNSNTIGANY